MAGYKSFSTWVMEMQNKAGLLALMNRLGLAVNLTCYLSGVVPL